MGIELSLAGISNLTKLLERLPSGEAARELARRIGAWNDTAHSRATAEKQPFPRNFADLSDDALSNHFSYWTSELVRITELGGLLEGQRKLLELTAKKERAAARSRIRAKYEDELANAEKGTKIPKPTAGEINDRAEDDEEVVKADTDLVTLDVVIASVSAYREACLAATSGLSREISLRQAQFSARVRA